MRAGPLSNGAELQLENEGYAVRLWNEQTYTLNSQDNSVDFDLEHLLDRERFELGIHYGVETVSVKGKILRCVLVAGGGTTSIHQSSAFLRNDSLVVGLGDRLCSLSLRDLEMQWNVKADSCTCFGIHHLEPYKCYIVHGECEISRFTYAGEKQWETIGKDIFTGGFRILDDVILAEDFNGEKYRINIETGASQVLRWYHRQKYLW